MKTIGIVAVTMSLVAGVALHVVDAQQAGATRTELQRHALSTPGREVIQVRVDLEPGYTFPGHTHPGEEIIYVIQGEWAYDIGGKHVTARAGDVLFVPAGTIHSAKNAGTGNAAELATYVVAKGQPLLTLAGEDRFTLTSPDGIAFGEFRGYDAWPVITPSQPDGIIKAIVGNPVMIKAFSEGIPGNGQPVPDGAVMAKIEWSSKNNPDLPGAARVPDMLKNVGFMVKDARRFPETDGWGYAQFDYDAASGTFKPLGSKPGFAKAACHQCHTRVKDRDFVFTRYAQR